MTDPEKWERIGALFQRALALPPDQRAEFLREQCEDDAPVLAEVASLVEAHAEAEGFLDRPVPRAPSDVPRLASGSPLGVFEILERLGAGGMGEVYRARDTRLGRLVAVKVLSADLASDPRGRERFEREAHIISKLTHPHICTLHDVGSASVQGVDVPFLVMELLEGETLATRLARGPLPLAQALRDRPRRPASAKAPARSRRSPERAATVIGETIGPYQVVAKLGDGGMGQVYRATDTKLKRQVAIEILPGVGRERSRSARTRSTRSRSARVAEPSPYVSHRQVTAMMKPTAIALVSVVLALGTVRAAGPQATSDRRLLAPSFPVTALRSVLLDRDTWRPYPTASNPAGLERVPARVRQAYIEEGVRRIEGDWPPLPSSVFLEYVRTGNRSNYEAISFARRSRLAHLVLAELFERKGRFLDQVVNGIWAISEESFWGVPAHLGMQDAGPGLPDVSEPVVDLFAAETGALMAWTSYLLGPALDSISPLITKRMTLETERRILQPYLEREDWGYLGYNWRRRTGYVRPVNNWNPWVNSNVLTAALILEQDPDRRLRLVHKVMETLDAFVEPYPADGGCDEGPSYWNRAGGSLFDVLDLLHSASSGRIDVFDTPLVKAIGQYIYRTYIGGPYFINFADASARIAIEAPLVFRFGRAIGDRTMMGFAALAARQQQLGDGVLPASFGVLGRVLPALFSLDALSAEPPVEPLVRDTWFPDLQVMAARSTEGTRDGFYLAAKGGHNDESHNHNDVGNFIVYHDGRPVLIDAGAQTYTAATFSSRRYELWNNQSGFHTLPTINGVMQKEGRSFAARGVRYHAEPDYAQLSLDIAGAYPEAAHVTTWQRTVTLHRGRDVEVQERYQLSAIDSPLTLNYLTVLRADTAAPGRLRLSDPGDPAARAFVLIYDDARFTPSVETIPVTDTRMRGSWGDDLRRIVLTSKATTLADTFQVRIDVE